MRKKNKMDKVHHGNKWMPIMYVTYYGIMKQIAEEHGWALALHGSMTRDLDLVAIPWVEKPKPILEVFWEFNRQIGFINEVKPFDTTCEKPHGQRSYTLITGSGGYIDIRVMPIQDGASQEENNKTVVAKQPSPQLTTGSTSTVQPLQSSGVICTSDCPKNCKDIGTPECRHSPAS